MTENTVSQITPIVKRPRASGVFILFQFSVLKKVDSVLVP